MVMWKFHPLPASKPIGASSVVPELKGKKFITWRVKGKRDTLTMSGVPAPTIASTGIPLEGRKAYADVNGLKLLSGFPRDFKFVGGARSAVRQMGNCVPPPMMAAVAVNLSRGPFMDSTRQPTVISTFSGCGGSSLGYKMAGFRELLAVEWDDNAVATFRLNFPDVPVYHGDIRKLSGEECMELAGVESGELDVLDGSPPCQGFSPSGNREFLDRRNQLYMEFARLLGELRPRAFVMENVPGLISGAMKTIYLDMLAAFREKGYVVKGQILNAMYYGVPQSRRRVIVVGVRSDLGIKPSHPKPEGKPITVGEAILGAPNHPCVPVGRDTMRYHLLEQTAPGMCAKDHHPKGHFFTWFRLSNNKPGNTVITGTYQFHPTENRFMSEPEEKRLCSFSDDFRFPDDRLRVHHEQMGNAVPPNLMRAIACHLKDKIL